jgi:purine-nucleoside phosphorylase
MIPSIDQVEAAAGAIRRQWAARPRLGIILGTGLGGFARQIGVEARLNYESIPHFPRATALGHQGAWVCGTLGGAKVVAMDGRFHGYEGYSPAQVTFPVRVMSALGIELLIISNACGGMNPNFRPGDVMIIEDHINFTSGNPLVGPHDAKSGLGYPDMSRPYDPRLIERACEIARRNNFVAHPGTYVGVTGPNYETRAEYRFFRRIGGDAVGMSTVWEVIVAAQCGLRVLGLSVVTNVSLPDHLQPTDAHQVAAVAASAEPKLRAIVLGIVEQLAAAPSRHT